MEIKVCGLTRPKEAEYLNQNGIDYAGFILFYKKSKRYITLERAKEIGAALAPGIRRVAVTVSPTAEQIEKINGAGFHILQVHGTLSGDALRAAELPVWIACNLSGEEKLAETERYVNGLSAELSGKIAGLVVDGAEYGSGKPFSWRKSRRLLKAGALSPPQEDFLTGLRSARSFVLAGGLNAENVAEGINLFHPDIVDVSSGVEGENGKDEARIARFAEQVRRTAGSREKSI